MTEQNGVISSIDRALEILLYLHSKKKEMGISEISRDLGIYKSTIHRTLNTLEHRGFISQNPDNGKYWLGLKLYALGMAVGEGLDLKGIVKPFAQELSDRFNESVNVSVLDFQSGDVPMTMIIHKVEVSSHRVRIDPQIGELYLAYSSAVGKSMLAFSESKVIESMRDCKFTRHTSNTIGSYEELLEELETIRKTGVSIDNEEEEIGLTCVASPIFDGNRKVIAAISLTGPTFRMLDNNLEEIKKQVHMTANKISDMFM